MTGAHGTSARAAEIAARVGEVRARIAEAARGAGRDPAAVSLVAVTKGVPIEMIEAARRAGVTDLGENRAQELAVKAPALAASGPPPVWHFVGRLQRNKVGVLAPWVTWWQSVDRPELGATIARRAPGARVLVEVNLGAEPTKGGCAPAAVTELVEGLRGLGLAVEGLMTVPPIDADPRPFFARLRVLAEDLALGVVSMGMSADYELAISEGATMVRVGTAIFGPRPSTAGARR